MRGPRGTVRWSRLREGSSVVVVGEEVEVMFGLRRGLFSVGSFSESEGERGRVLTAL